MPPKFGTSGLRGLVTELTPELVADYTRAFLSACDVGAGLYVGRDLRASSPRIAQCVIETARAEGIAVTDCGAVPTPALALVSMTAGQGAVMVTGSHIPADRNGLKFYVPGGEISKADETAIQGALGSPAQSLSAPLHDGQEALAAYRARYVTAFGSDALTELKIGVYQHSSVARDVMIETLQALGAVPVALARSDTFIPVDTEALDHDTRAMLSGWCETHGLAAVVSTDGDADRPMVTDATGRIVPGDVLGVLTAQGLKARSIITPVSSNSLVQDLFPDVQLTRIGSPYVIAGMEQALQQDPAARVVGYEANGGFLLGFNASGPAGPLAPLMTRDCLLPILTPLVLARSQGLSLADLVGGLPPRFTAADRLQDIPRDAAQAFLARLTDSAEARQAFFLVDGPELAVDTTDGLRVRFGTGGRTKVGGDVIVHLRPSGNAPEFRCYVEADSPEDAQACLNRHLTALNNTLGTG